MADLTKKEIKATFLQLLDERPYNQITVKDIVRECGINRNTFYYHFADLPALVEAVIDEEISRFVREQISFSSMEESIMEALSFFRAHRRASYHVYNSVNRDIFDRYLMKNCESVGAGYVNSLLENNAIKLEVTETAYTENANQVIQVVNTLRQRGFQIEMDDFGTGYSSLNMLSNLPVDVLKMDQNFVRNIGRDEKDDRLVALILDIARNLNVPVVAEGVETKEQLAVLRELGCSYVQGYYFARALQPEDFEKLAFGAAKKQERHAAVRVPPRRGRRPRRPVRSNAAAGSPVGTAPCRPHSNKNRAVRTSRAARLCFFAYGATRKA